MTKMIHIAVLILVLSVLGIQSRSVGQCLDNLMYSVRAGEKLCPAADEYIRCAFGALNFQSTSMSETVLDSLENVLEQALTANKIDCNVDIRAILRKVKEDKTNSATDTTKRPTGYDDATTIGDCLNTFTRSTRAGEPSCLLINPYLKCVIRVSGLYKYENINDAFSSLDTQIKNTFRLLGVNCTFDIQEMSTEVAREQNYGN
ncbi:hypothetical protein BsWGS_09435 [Bradybaena similaris]